MSAPLPCDNHPDTQAAMLVTNLENGDTLTLCGPCVFQWAQMLVGVNFPEQYDQQLDAETAEEAGQPEAAAATPDPEPKSEPEEPAEESRPPEVGATLTQETQAPGE